MYNSRASFRNWLENQEAEEAEDLAEIKATNSQLPELPLPEPKQLPESIMLKRWLTPEEIETHLVSELLGQLKADGFVFAYPVEADGWLSAPPEYIQSLKAFHAYKVLVKQEHEATERVHERNQNRRRLYRDYELNNTKLRDDDSYSERVNSIFGKQGIDATEVQEKALATLKQISNFSSFEEQIKRNLKLAEITK